MNLERFSALDDGISSEHQILEKYTPEEQTEILNKKRILSSLAYFIGKDFKIPVELNEPGKGWHWDFKDNVIKIDPKDVLEKPMDYLRFVISHEGGHRRISRASFIPLEIWRQRGFSFLMNSIEDPRDNNFIASNVPHFTEQMKLAYNLHLAEEEKAKAELKDKIGYQPRFRQAGWEYIKQWFKEKVGEETEVSSDLPEDVRVVVKETLELAKDSWNLYPTKEEADRGGMLPDGDKVDGEGMITEYAREVYEIILEEIWPKFQTLIEKDLEDQKLAEMMKELMEKNQGGNSDEDKSGDKSEGKESDGKQGGMPEELRSGLTEDEIKELEEAIGKAGKESKAVDIDTLSPSLKDKLKEYLDNLQEDKKKELKEKSEKALKELEEKENSKIEGKISEKPSEKTDKKPKDEGEEGKEDKDAKDASKIAEQSKKILEKVRKSLEDEQDRYSVEMKRLSPQISILKEKLAEIFHERRKRGIKTGFDSGEEIDVERRMQEKAKDIPIFDSRAWRRTELPREKDYAITLLVDLSGSMNSSGKIEEAFNATVLFTEVLNSLGIKTEILGFNNRLYEYLRFNERFSNETRQKIVTMVEQVRLPGSEDNDDGWAVTEAFSRLKSRKEKEKLLLVISDGEPDNSPEHNAPKYDLNKVVDGIIKEGEVKIVGLGLGNAGIEAVKQYYPKHLLATNTEEMIRGISDLLLETING